jgi:hypothetical protein
MKEQVINSIFNVAPLPLTLDEELSYSSYQVEGVGQSTVKAVRKMFPKSIIVLKGFSVDGKYVPLRK